MGQTIGHILSADEYFEPLFVLLDWAMTFVGTFNKESVIFWTSCRPSMVKECNRVSESDVALLAATPIFFINKSHTFANVVEILRAFNNRLKQVIFAKKRITISLPPKVKEIMLKELEIAHEKNFFVSELSELFSHNLGIRFSGLWQSKTKDWAYLQLQVIHILITWELFARYPLLQFWDVVKIHVASVGELLKCIDILDCELDIWYFD